MRALDEQRAAAARRGPNTKVHRIEGLDELAVDPQALGRRLMALWANPNYSPPMLPNVAPQVLELSQRTDVAFHEVVGVLGQDPMLSAKVVEKARSPLYGGGNIRTLDEALSRLGLRGLRNLLLELALELKVFRSGTFGAAMAKVREHSVAVAHLSHLLAPRLHVDPNEAFLAGLVHDVGLAAGVLAVAHALPRGAPAAVAPYWRSIEAAHVEGRAAPVHPVGDGPGDRGRGGAPSRRADGRGAGSLGDRGVVGRLPGVPTGPRDPHRS